MNVVTSISQKDLTKICSLKARMLSKKLEAPGQAQKFM